MTYDKELIMSINPLDIAKELVGVQPMDKISFRDLANDPLANLLLENFVNSTRKSENDKA